MTGMGFEFHSPFFLQGLANGHCNQAKNAEFSVRLFLFRLCISKKPEANAHKYLIPFLLIHLLVSFN